MNTIFRLLLGLSFAVSLPSAAQTNAIGSLADTASTNEYRLVLVTNWVQPWASLRVVAGQVYDVNYSQLWQWVTIPEGATVLNAQYNGSVQPTDLTFTWLWRAHEGHDHEYTVTVYNFPYDPVYFRHVEGEHGVIATAAPLQLRLFPINVQTNWSPLGREFVGTSTYDYGLACTGLVPIPSWQRVPLGATNAPAITMPSSSPATQTANPQMPAPVSLKGTFADRLALTLNYSDVHRKDATLQILADDAARAGNVDIVEQSLFGISNESTRDNTTATVAQVLSRQGLRTDAIRIAESITNPHQRTLIIEILNQQ